MASARGGEALAAGCIESGEALPAGCITIRLVGHTNVGKSSLLNALLARKGAKVSRHPGSTRRPSSYELCTGVWLRDSAPLSTRELTPACGQSGAQVCMESLQQLCGLSPLAGVREPYSAVRLIAESLGGAELLRTLNVPLALALEASDADGELSPHGICSALAARRGFQVSRNGAPDAHRAGRLSQSD